MRYCTCSDIKLLLLLETTLGWLILSNHNVYTTSGSIATVVGQNFQPAQCAFHLG